MMTVYAADINNFCYIHMYIYIYVQSCGNMYFAIFAQL